MTTPHDLSQRTRARIQEKLGLHEQRPPLPLRSPLSPTPVGEVRVLAGGPLCRLMYVALALPQLGLDSHMLFAATPPEQMVPHFTLDAVQTGDSCSLHLDLLPRLELATHLDYMDLVYRPLTPALEALRQLEGVSPVQLPVPHQALLNPWSIVGRAIAAAFARIEPIVTAYLEHWLALVARGVTLPEPGPAVITERDRRYLMALFSPSLDPVWSKLERLLGSEQTGRVRGILLGTE